MEFRRVLCRSVGGAVISGHQRRAGAPDLADRLIGQDVAALVADLDRHVADRAAAIDDRAVSGRPVGVAGGARQLGFLDQLDDDAFRSEEHTSELQSLMRISYAVFCLTKKKTQSTHLNTA